MTTPTHSEQAPHGNPDARAWAAYFVCHVKDNSAIATDEGCMIGWFANAMMAMHDHIKRTAQPVTEVLPPMLCAKCGKPYPTNGPYLMPCLCDKPAQPVTVTVTQEDIDRAAVAICKRDGSPQTHDLLCVYRQYARTAFESLAAAIGRVDKQPVMVSEGQVEAACAIYDPMWSCRMDVERTAIKQRMRAALEHFAAAIGRGGEPVTLTSPATVTGAALDGVCYPGCKASIGALPDAPRGGG